MVNRGSSYLSLKYHDHLILLSNFTSASSTKFFDKHLVSMMRCFLWCLAMVQIIGQSISMFDEALQADALSLDSTKILCASVS